MAKLIYTATCSLDGYVVDANGSFDFAAPSEQVHAFLNETARPVGTFLFGRRMYETMRGWEDEYGVDGDPEVTQDFAAIYRAADKVVFSTTLDAVTTPRTALEHVFEPAAIRRRTVAAGADLSVGGATLASAALRAGVVDEISLMFVPVLVGGGTKALPDGVRADLELLEQRRFDDGWTYQRYAVAAG
jgi:dihydrofolate reductase